MLGVRCLQAKRAEENKTNMREAAYIWKGGNWESTLVVGGEV